MLDAQALPGEYAKLMGLYVFCLAAGFMLKVVGRALRPASIAVPALRAGDSTPAGLRPQAADAGTPGAAGPGIGRKFKVFFLFQAALISLAFWSLPGLAGFFLILFGFSAWEILSLHRLAAYPAGYGFRPWPAYGLLAGFGISLAAWLALAAHPQLRPFLAFVFLLVAVADGYAQITGQILGGPKIVPRISPGKTWSGLLGGMAFCALTAWFGGCWLLASGGPAGAAGRSSEWAALGLGAVIGALAFLGDITASWVKRRMGIKDFSNLLGPQGGVLDRGDSLIWAGPALWVFWACGMAAEALPGISWGASKF